MWVNASTQNIKPFALDHVEWNIMSCGWSSSPPAFEGCPGVDTVFFNCDCAHLAGMSVNEKEKIKVYPVPAVDKLMLDLSGEGTVCIYDAIGEVVLRSELKSQQKEINVAELKPGIYFIEMISDEKQFSAKFIKQ